MSKAEYVIAIDLVVGTFIQPSDERGFLIIDRDGRVLRFLTVSDEALLTLYRRVRFMPMVVYITESEMDRWRTFARQNGKD